MKDVFYDVKLRQKVDAEVTEKVTYGSGTRTRYALKAKTSDGRNLTKFVSKVTWDKLTV